MQYLNVLGWSLAKAESNLLQHCEELIQLELAGQCHHLVGLCLNSDRVAGWATAHSASVLFGLLPSTVWLAQRMRPGLQHLSVPFDRHIEIRE